jgi:hypothetical protein
MKAAGQLIGGLSDKAQSNAAAAQLRGQAAREAEIGEVRVTDFERQASAAKASSVAASGASGIAQSDFEDARANFDQEVALQALRIRANTQTRINALSTEADNVKKQGDIGLFTSGLNAGSTFLSGGRGSKTIRPRGISIPSSSNNFGVQFAPRINGKLFE